MVLDYDTLSTWQTPDLLSRDSILVNKTRVMGMSETAAIIHIVALVCTVGASLPINLAFGVWHSHRYDEVKKERMWIRQILGTRNMAYMGQGHWAQVQPTPNTRQKVRVQPTPNIRQRSHVTPATPHTNNGTQMQFAHANATVNNSQQDSGRQNSRSTFTVNLPCFHPHWDSISRMINAFAAAAG